MKSEIESIDLDALRAEAFRMVILNLTGVSRPHASRRGRVWRSAHEDISAWINKAGRSLIRTRSRSVTEVPDRAADAVQL